MLFRSCAGRNVEFATCLAIVTLLAAPVVGVHAQDVQPGFDLFATDPTSNSLDFTFVPIPADFFGPGSDPFDGGVPAVGVPLPDNPLCPPELSLCPDDDLSAIHIIVERLSLAALPAVGDSATIPIEIVALSLRSINPITVTYNGGLDPELWDVDVCLSSEPQETGDMLIRKTHAGGGNFDSLLPVTLRIVFTRVSDSEQRILDTWTDYLGAYGVPWEYDNPHPLSCRSNFCTPDQFMKFGYFSTLSLLPTCWQALPAIPTTGLIVLIATLAGVGVFVIRRFTRRASDIT